MIGGKIFVSGLLIAIFFLVSTARAQESALTRSEIAIQGDGTFTKDSHQFGAVEHSTNAGGVLFSYRFHFNRWFAADLSYGYDRSTQENFLPVGIFKIQNNVHQATGALVANLPFSFARFKPYALAGTGALVFSPTGKFGESVPGEQREARAVFLYGVGVDYRIIPQIALRVEYRGFVYDRPTFGIAALPANVITHTAQPSAGFVLRF
jgi:opacity protein-like surface antigen